MARVRLAMRVRISRWALLLLAVGASAEDLDSRALNIIASKCSQCHSAAVQMSDFDLSRRDTALKGGKHGPAIVPGDAKSSALYQAVARTAGKLAMPPGPALNAAETETLKEWIDAGAHWPDTQSAAQPKGPQWWAFRKPVQPAIPKSGSKWASNAVDEFILAKLNTNSLQPAPEATRAVLGRRLYFDLTGLPPTAAQMKAFVDEKSPEAYSKLVEELLASPRYGEKWGRHWLDLARYSDTSGFELDSYIADAWRYRDWVIDSFNQDKPYDRFIKEQLAGDEFFPEDPVAQTGTGFFCVGPNRDAFANQADINRVETLTDFVDTTAGVFLGLTVGCARCHDHKYDPIPQRDYYRLQAVFAPAVKKRVPLERLPSQQWEVMEAVNEIKLREIGEQIRAIEERCRKKISEEKPSRPRVTDDAVDACLSREEREKLTAIDRRLRSMFAGYRSKPFACGLTDVGDHSPKTFLPVKGMPKGEEVHAGFLTALGGGDIPELSFERPTTGPVPLAPTTGRRKALADWIAGPDNPLTARVMVNRIWQYYFGRGLAASPSDFGARGREPSHPQLLDWLAVKFVEGGWSVKNIHRLILNSATYRQSSEASAEAQTKDPENVWLSHFRRRRLDAEELRDAVLFSAGTLNLKAGGRPVVPPLSKEELLNMTGSKDNMWIVTADEREHTRRSIYLLQKRTFRLPMMEVFDAPDSMVTCSRRDKSTSAPQSLTLLNSRFMLSQARRAAAALIAKANADDAATVQSAWRMTFAREPQPQEQREAEMFLAVQWKNEGTRESAVMELMRGLFNLNEFLYVD